MSLKIGNECVKDLAVMQSAANMCQTGLDWKEYPVMLSQEEGKALCLPQIQAILQGKTKSPYEIAGISRDDHQAVALSVKKIQIEYSKALEDYRDEIFTAYTNDSEVIQRLRNKRRHPLGFRPCVRFIRLIFSTIFRCTLPEDPDDEHIQREGSSHRRICICAMNRLEEKRLNKAQKYIDRRALVLLSPVQKMQENGEFNMSFVRELRQLMRIREALFPNQPCIAQNIDMQNFVQQLPQ